MSLKKINKSFPSENVTAGYLSQDWDVLDPRQRECSKRFATTVQIEQEAYLSQHPEVKAMLEVFVAKMVCANKRREILKEAAEHFTRPIDQLDMEIRERLSISSSGTPYYFQPEYTQFGYEDVHLEQDLRNIVLKHSYTPPPGLRIPSVHTPDTDSSSFMSIMTSETTIPTPERIPTPEPTFYETMFTLVSNTVDTAIFLHLDDRSLRYDFAYVELMKAVEEAMEITVIDIKEDIATLLYNAYKMFELDIMEKERIAAELAWQNRISKKVTRSLRLAKHFKGYETPKSVKSEASSLVDRKSVPRPCPCYRQFRYNRYAKDRFGIYLPREEKFEDGNVTTTPAISEGLVSSSTDIVKSRKKN